MAETTTAPRRRWAVIGVLAAGQFVMVLDGTVMNVSISQLVVDLDTSVTSIQLAITAYTLVMAALMLTGGKLGDLLGRKRAFTIGLAVYGTGSLITAVAPNLGILLLGWSLVEGLGAVLVVPSIMALTAGNYAGRERALAYGILGGVAAAGVAVGPLIGGWVTTNLSWRYVFGAETVIVVVLIAAARLVDDVAAVGPRTRLDLGGTVLSAAGLGLTVLAVLQSSTWGWVRPRRPPQVGGRDLTVLGFSPTVPTLLVGVAVLGAFVAWERRQEAGGRPVLVHLHLLRIPALRAGLTTILLQQLLLAGTFFVLPLYLQVVLGLDAFHSGMAILPLSIAMFVTALGASRLGASVAPRRLVRIGLAVMAVAELLLLGVIDPDLRSRPFALALALLGVGVGLLASQLGNVVLSSVDRDASSEAGGLQGTAQNLGASLGTALIGAILLGGLTGGFQAAVGRNDALAPEVRTAVAERAAAGLQFVPAPTVRTVAAEAGLAPETAEAVADAYSDAQLVGLKSALAAVALLSFLAFFLTGRIPATPLAPDDRSSADRG